VLNPQLLEKMTSQNQEVEIPREHLLDHAWVAYISPFSFVVPDDEEPLEVSLDEINNNSYDHGKLCRIVARFPLNEKGLEKFRMAICYDGALAVPRYKSLSQKEHAIRFFSTVLCNLLLGGIYCEAIDARDVVWGQLYKKQLIWPVSLGQSVSSQLHASLRTRKAGPLQTILLSNPRLIRLSEFKNAFKVGAQVTNKIRNFSPQFLIRGVTELQDRNWSAALSNLWICVEQLTDFMWEKKFVKDSTKHPKQPLSGRLKALRGDTRTWSMAVKQEILFQDGLIDEETFTRIYPARQARNQILHNGKDADTNTSIDLFDGVCRMFAFCVDAVDLPLSRTVARERLIEDKQPKHTMNDDFFSEWLSFS
jgi:hypothetical protein